MDSERNENSTTFLGQGKVTECEGIKVEEIIEESKRETDEKAKDQVPESIVRRAPLRQRISAMLKDQETEKNNILPVGNPELGLDAENIPNLNLLHGVQDPVKVFKRMVISKNGRKRYVYHCIHGKRKGDF